jgi:hypothetical protein
MPPGLSNVGTVGNLGNVGMHSEAGGIPSARFVTQAIFGTTYGAR